MIPRTRPWSVYASRESSDGAAATGIRAGPVRPSAQPARAARSWTYQGLVDVIAKRGRNMAARREGVALGAVGRRIGPGEPARLGG